MPNLRHLALTAIAVAAFTPAHAQVAPPATPAPRTEPATESPEQREERLRIDRIALEKARIDAGLELAALKARKARIAEDAERAKLEAEAALRAAKLALEFAATDEAKAAAERALALDALKNTLATFDSGLRLREQETDTKIARMELDNELARVNAKIAAHKQEKESDRIIASANTAYPENPLIDGVLHISDRRIPLNGPITEPLARRIIDRVNFLNLRNPKAPIFIVIDSSPGGSLMAGYQVIKAIESSRAPVHVVVKGSAHSMAAAIAARAPRSYAFASSVIVHEQASASARGNFTQTGERREQVKQFYDRIYDPVAKKMGAADTEAFIKLLYAHNSNGEWTEFGDKAVEHKWIDTLITRVVEDGVDDIGLTPGATMAIEFSTHKTEDGKTILELPPLASGDAWLLHDPQGLYGTR